MQRRDFLKSAGNLVIGVILSNRTGAEPPLSPNAWVRIDRTGAVTLLIEKADIGQGAWTALAMILAEELEAEWSKVRLERAPMIEGVYHNTGTWGSDSVRSSWMPLRRAGAQAHELLIAAAMVRWKAPHRECRADSGCVIHTLTGHKIPFGELVDIAASLPPPDVDAVSLKNSSQFRLIGRALQQKELPAKINGTSRYGVDVRLPGMLYAVVARCPAFRGKAKNYDDRAAKAVPGVRAIFPIEPIGKDIQSAGGIACCGGQYVGCHEGPRGPARRVESWPIRKRVFGKPSPTRRPPVRKASAFLRT